MPRRSRESLQVVAIEGVSPTLEPPKHLSSDEAALFRSDRGVIFRAALRQEQFGGVGLVLSKLFSHLESLRRRLSLSRQLEGLGTVRPRYG